MFAAKNFIEYKIEFKKFIKEQSDYFSKQHNTTRHKLFSFNRTGAIQSKMEVLFQLERKVETSQDFATLLEAIKDAIDDLVCRLKKNNFKKETLFIQLNKIYGIGSGLSKAMLTQSFRSSFLHYNNALASGQTIYNLQVFYGAISEETRNAARESYADFKKKNFELFPNPADTERTWQGNHGGAFIFFNSIPFMCNPDDPCGIVEIRSFLSAHKMHRDFLDFFASYFNATAIMNLLEQPRTDLRRWLFGFTSNPDVHYFIYKTSDPKQVKIIYEENILPGEGSFYKEDADMGTAFSLTRKLTFISHLTLSLQKDKTVEIADLYYSIAGCEFIDNDDARDILQNLFVYLMDDITLNQGAQNSIGDEGPCKLEDAGQELYDDFSRTREPPAIRRLKSEHDSVHRLN